MIRPISTEKSEKQAKQGAYSFWVDKLWDKGRIKSEVASKFKVRVISVKTISYLGKKKAIVTLKEGQKIEAFEEKKKK